MADERNEGWLSYGRHAAKNGMALNLILTRNPKFDDDIRAGYAEGEAARKAKAAARAAAMAAEAEAPKRAARQAKPSRSAQPGDLFGHQQAPSKHRR